MKLEKKVIEYVLTQLDNISTYDVYHHLSEKLDQLTIEQDNKSEILRILNDSKSISKNIGDVKSWLRTMLDDFQIMNIQKKVLEHVHKQLDDITPYSDYSEVNKILEKLNIDSNKKKIILYELDESQNINIVIHIKEAKSWLHALLDDLNKK